MRAGSKHEPYRLRIMYAVVTRITQDTALGGMRTPLFASL